MDVRESLEVSEPAQPRKRRGGRRGWPPPLGERSWYTGREVAERLEITVATVSRLAVEGSLPGFRTTPRGHWRFPKSPIDTIVMRGYDDCGLTPAPPNKARQPQRRNGR